MHDSSLKGSLREFWNYRVYLKYETLGKIKRRHKGTYLGYVWWLLDPLIFLALYFFLVQVIFKKGGENYVVFLWCALLSWRWFTTSLMEACLSIRSSAGLIKQIYFPKLIPPVATVFTNTVGFFVGLIIMAALLVIYKLPPGWNLAYFPLIVLVQFAVTIGIGLILADLDVFMKDTGVLTGHVLQMWFYLSPGIYPVKLIPVYLRDIYMLNPFAIIFTSYRDVLMHNRRPDVIGLAVILLGSLGLITVGVKLIAKRQGEYAKIL